MHNCDMTYLPTIPAYEAAYPYPLDIPSETKVLGSGFIEDKNM